MDVDVPFIWEREDEKQVFHWPSNLELRRRQEAEDTCQANGLNEIFRE